MIVRRVGPSAAGQVYDVVQAAFKARPALDPPGDALSETPESLAGLLSGSGGLLAESGGEAVGTLVLDRNGDWLWLRRVGVLPGRRGHGVARELVAEAEQIAAELGCVGVRLVAREELPQTVQFWTSLGYAEVARTSPYLELAKRLPVTVVLPDLDATASLGARLAGLLTAGDLIILSGGLGAGKTTLTQSLGRALGVRGGVTSPTFVIARVHPGPLPLVHVDAYRLGDAAELDDLDLDTDLDAAVTVVEWGSGLAESLAEDRLEIALTADPLTESRTAVITPRGARWVDAYPS